MKSEATQEPVQCAEYGEKKSNKQLRVRRTSIKYKEPRDREQHFLTEQI